MLSCLALPCLRAKAGNQKITHGTGRKVLGGFSLLTGLLLAGSASANPVTTISANGKNYAVTYQQLNLSSPSALFPLQSQPWWGNQSLSLELATNLAALGYALNANSWNSGVPGPPGTPYSAWIAYSKGALSGFNNQVGFAVYNEGPPPFAFDCPEGSCLVNFIFPWSFLTIAFSANALQPYATNQSVGLDALKNQREIILNQAGECNQRGWIVHDSGKTQSNSRTNKQQSLCVFVEGSNANGTINGTTTLGGYNSANASSAYGLEWKLSRQWVIGAAYGYGSTNLSNFNFQDTTAAINSTINSGSIYGVYRPDRQQRWKIVALFGTSSFNYTGSRSYLGDTATSAYNASGFTGALQASYDIPLTTNYNGEKNRLSPVHIKPMLGIAYGSHQQDGFSESGAGTLVNVQGQTTNSLLGTVGVSLEAPIPLNKQKTTVLSPHIGVAYQVDFLADQDGNRSITAALQDEATTSYTVQGQIRGANTLYLNLGADLQLNPKAVLYAGVNYQAFNNGDQIGYQGGLRYRF